MNDSSNPLVVLPRLKLNGKETSANFKLDLENKISSRSRAMMKDFLTKSFDVSHRNTSSKLIRLKTLN